MCLIARHLEENGIPTLIIASALDITYPLGHTTGKPFDAADQKAILREALAAFGRIDTPETIVVDLGHSWDADGGWKQAATDTSSGDQRQPRDTSPRYQYEADRLAAEARWATAAS